MLHSGCATPGALVAPRVAMCAMCSVAAGQTLADSADRDTDIDELLRDVFKMSDSRGNQ